MGIIQMIAIGCYYIILFQLTTIIHEMGHAIPARILSKDKVTILLGVGNNKKIFNIGNFIVVLSGFHPFTGFVNYNEEKLTRLGKFISTLGGPLISLLVGVGGLLIAGKISNTILYRLFRFAAFYNLYQFVVTIIPIKYPNWWGAYSGFASDGYRIVTFLKESKKTIC
ncbi:zinc metalloprotease [Alkaliphilus transvaalensis]|uniref:M50 family metallopeptidase n=1 Tax=Alkaliphilus transvaalensis TaxID=114628 RepID=UPI00047884AB|nr:M50 family metallopeptidase [Alkaliphilus transvaalensis]